MTLSEAFADFAAAMHLRTIRRYLGWRVLNAANTNHLCPVEGCVWPKGSACTMSGCPGRAFKNPRAASSPTLSRGQPQGVGVQPDAHPRIYPINPHTPAHSGDVA